MVAEARRVGGCLGDVDGGDGRLRKQRRTGRSAGQATGAATRLRSVLGLREDRSVRRLTARLLLVVFALAALAAAGCAADGRSPDGDQRYDPRPRDFNQQPGFTPFSA